MAIEQWYKVLVSHEKLAFHLQLLFGEPNNHEPTDDREGEAIERIIPS